METYSRQRMLNILKASKSNNDKVMFVYRRIFNYVDETIIFKAFILKDHSIILSNLTEPNN